MLADQRVEGGRSRPVKKYGDDKTQGLESILDMMVHIEGGIVELRDYVDVNKWISSDYTLSDPGGWGNKKLILRTETVEPFYVMKYPVTKGLYHGVMKGAKPESDADNLPMTDVSWTDAIVFCNEISKILGRTECYTNLNDSRNTIYNKDANGFRLLTDAEWQYACKAGTSGYRYGPLSEIAWYKDNSNGTVQEVGKLLPNPWGMYDMLGNVWEWCWDLYDPERYGDYRIFRGGSWAEVANNCGSTTRRKSMPNFKIDDLGFRIALSK